MQKMPQKKKKSFNIFIRADADLYQAIRRRAKIMGVGRATFIKIEMRRLLVESGDLKSPLD